jgi:hypothetical protein
MTGAGVRTVLQCGTSLCEESGGWVREVGEQLKISNKQAYGVAVVV